MHALPVRIRWESIDSCEFQVTMHDLQAGLPFKVRLPISHPNDSPSRPPEWCYKLRLSVIIILSVDDIHTSTDEGGSCIVVRYECTPCGGGESTVAVAVSCSTARLPQTHDRYLCELPAMLRLYTKEYRSNHIS